MPDEADPHDEMAYTPGRARKRTRPDSEDVFAGEEQRRGARNAESWFANLLDDAVPTGAGGGVQADDPRRNGKAVKNNAGEVDDSFQSVWKHFEMVSGSNPGGLREYLESGWQDHRDSEEEDLSWVTEEYACRLSHDAYEEYASLRELLVGGELLSKLDGASVTKLVHVFADMNSALVSMQKHRTPEDVKRKLTKTTKVLHDIRRQIGHGEGARPVGGLPMPQMTFEESAAQYKKALMENLSEEYADMLINMHEDALPDCRLDGPLVLSKWIEGLGCDGNALAKVKSILSEQPQSEVQWAKDLLACFGLFIDSEP